MNLSRCIAIFILLLQSVLVIACFGGFDGSGANLNFAVDIHVIDN